MVVGLKVPILGDTSNLEAALGKAGGGVKGFGDLLGGINPVALAAGGAIGVAAGAIVEMTKAASEDRDEQGKLEQTIIAAGAATGDYTALVDEAIAAGQDRAFTDSEVRAGLGHLVVATGSVAEATGELKLAQDIARYSGVSLEDASKAVAKAYGGQAGALQKLLPGMTKTTSGANAISQAIKITAGQADKFANSAEGMGMRSSDAFAEIGETIGSAFLPVLDELLPALIPILKQLATLVQTILPLLIPLVKILAAALSVVVRVLSTVVGWIVQLVTWLTRAIAKLGAFLDKINPLKGIKLPSLPFLSGASAAAGPTASSRGAATGASSAGVIVNVYGALDPEATARQIRRILAGHAARTGAGVAI